MACVDSATRVENENHFRYLSTPTKLKVVFKINRRTDVSQKKWIFAAIALLACLATSAGAEGDGAAQPDSDANAERIDQLEASIGTLADEMDSLRKVFALPEDGPLLGYSGLGAGASKVYYREKGLSIGGYGEVRFRGQVADENGDQDIFDALRMVLYAGYKFNDWLVFNSELEFEHAGSGGGGSVSTEFMTLDFLLHDAVNLRAGLLLLPMGFINERHEPLFFFSNARPAVDRRIIPTTWRENGAGIYGSFYNDRVDYRIYVVNGLDALGFDDNGFRGGRQKGSEALANDFALVARFDVEPISGFMVGGSVYHGRSGQDQRVCTAGCDTATPTDEKVPGAMTTIWEIHGEMQRWNATIRGMYAASTLSGSARLSELLGLDMDKQIAKRMNGGYISFGYNVMPFFLPESEMTLEPFYRYERLNTQRDVVNGDPNRLRDRRYHVVGLQYKPHPQVVLKLDYRNIDSAGGELPDEIEVGFGFVF